MERYLTMNSSKSQPNKNNNNNNNLVPFDFDSFEKNFIQGVYDGKPLSGEQGLLTPLVKQLLEKALQAELDTHLGYTKHQQAPTSNKRNGSHSKTLKSSFGSFDLETPRDRDGTFTPLLVKKRQTVLTDELDQKVISLYAHGMSNRDIETHFKDLYGIDLSPSMISTITDTVLPLIKEWQNRPLDQVYPFVFMDAIHYKVREDGQVVQKAVYLVLALNTQGKKEILGLYLNQSEGAKFWLQVLTDLTNRGLKDILIASIDNLKGFAEAIESVFPQAEVQLCVIHQIRNSLKYVTWKDKKAFMKDLKKVYQALTKDEAELELLNLEEKWGKKYPIVLKSWNHNWERLSTFFNYPAEIRRIMYTTNWIEAVNRQLRKVTKTKSAFVNDEALEKSLFLALENISKKWTMPVPNWSHILSQLAIRFEERLDLGLKI